ncbi:MAG: sulfatase [Armatimonadota bacterium]|nr:sulfatase [Armatimonadota bacterium]MCX7777200.1 sulfatase [Armatimonadota bacterium]MDW8025027.1 sulfatase [Armatimonadota bacterium]
MELSRREFLKQLSGTVFLPIILRSAGQSQNKRLNILFIAVDDLNRRLGCYGDSAAKTPNIDRLAENGVVFRRAYCQYPLCNPSRTSFLSGLYPTETRIMDNNTLPRTYIGDIAFLPQHFRKHGYFTARVGKVYHGGMDDAASWDISEDPRRTIRQQRRRQRQQDAKGHQADTILVGLAAQQRQQVLPLIWHATEGEDVDEPDGLIAQRAVRILEEHLKTRKNQPFFIAVGFHKPHLPWVAPKRYFDMHDPEKMPLPKTPPDDLADIPRVALTLRPQEREMDDEQKRLAIRAYYACVSFMDAQVGVLLDALDRHKLLDETIVVLLGDHGFHLGEHGGLWRKMTLFDESAGAPLIIAAPNTKGKGKSCNRVVEFVDIYPTLCELCGLPMPEHNLSGRSLLTLLNDTDAKWEKPAFTFVRRGKILGISISTERWRYIEWDEGRFGAELYDHENDPKEWKNLADDQKYSDVIKEMKELMRKWILKAK